LQNGGFCASYDSFVVGSSTVLRFNFCAENQPLRKAEHRYKVIVTTPAKEDIRESCLWYTQQESGLAKRFRNEIRIATKKIHEILLLLGTKKSDIHNLIFFHMPFILLLTSF
jgi:hypothetical protein